MRARPPGAVTRNWQPPRPAPALQVVKERALSAIKNHRGEELLGAMEIAREIKCEPDQAYRALALLVGERAVERVHASGRGKGRNATRVRYRLTDIANADGRK